MSEISLRAYIRDIEKQVDSGRTDEAIAHCRHILQSYPKYVEAYRLLGKAFLESQRFGDAADIFQRVLSSTPDDFVSHVGMSIIREDEGNLDEAIWHMERAFEVQPSNGAIQEELRRLHGKRDNVEPPKVRLTRGALARMYFRGELYTQAIAEVRGALAENPNRLDLQTLLAEIYHKAGQQVEAAEMANTVLRKLPYNVVANRIMTEVLSGTERDNEAQNFAQRIVQIDPYYAYLSPKAPSLAEIPEQAIKIEKLDWTPGQTTAEMGEQPAWAASLGISLATSAEGGEALPDWLSPGLSQESSPAPVQPAATPSTPAFSLGEPETVPSMPAADEEIPDWMKEAGWGAATSEGATAESAYKFEEPLPSTGEGELASAEIPDWLQQMAPVSPTEAEPTAEEINPWLDQIFGAAPEKGAPIVEEKGSETPEWLQAGPPTDMQPAEEAAEEMPDWLQEVGAATAGVAAEAGGVGEFPDWLSQAGEGEAAPAEPVSEEPSEELPEWLSATQVEAPQAEAAQPPAEELPDWLLEAQAEPPQAKAEQPPAEELPTWLLETKEAAPTGTTAEEAAEAEAMAAAEEALRAEEIPAWLFETKAEAPQAEETLAAQPSEAQPAEESIDWLFEEAIETQPTLEGIAAQAEEVKIGSEAELPELLTQKSEAEVAEAEVISEKPEEELPAWLLEAEATAPTEVVAEEAIEAEAISPPEEALPAEELPEWLLEAKPEALEAEAEQPAEELPAWLLEAEAAAPVEHIVKEAVEAEAVEAPEEALPAEELPEWLLEAKPEALEVEAVQPTEELPEWLLEAEAAAPVEQAAEEVVEAEALAAEEALPAEELPEWLLEAKPEALEVEAVQPTEELPAWLVEAEAAAPTEVAAEEAVKTEAEAPPEEALPIEELPEWLLEAKPEALEVEAVQSPTEELPTQPFEAAAPLEEVAEESVEAGAMAATTEAPLTEEFPEWLFTGEAEAPLKATTDEAPEAEAVQPAEESLDWLFAEVSEVPPATEETVSEAEGQEWLAQEGEPEPAAAEVMAEQPTQELPVQLPEAEEAIQAEQIVEEAIPAEAIAAEAVSPAEPLIERVEEIPQTEVAAESIVVAEISPAAGEPISEDKDMEDALAWLESMLVEEETPVEGEAPVEAEVEAPEEGAGEIVTSVIEESPVTEQMPPIEATPPAEAMPDLAAMDAEAAFAWLESLAVKQGATEALLLTPEERVETPPEWVVKEAAAQPAEEPIPPESTLGIEAETAAAIGTMPEEAPPQEPLIEVTEAQVPEVSAPAPELAEEAPIAGTPEESATAQAIPDLAAMDAEAAFAWLESLAVKQGATEALLLAPEERMEKPPEWVIQEATAQPVEAPTQPESEADLGIAAVEEEVLLEQPEEIPPAGEVHAPEVPAAEAPVTEIAAEEVSAPEVPTTPEVPQAVPATTEMDAEAAFAWLESLAVKQGAQEALLLKPEERQEMMPDWVLRETTAAAAEEQPEIEAPLEAEEIPEAIKKPLEDIQPPAGMEDLIEAGGATAETGLEVEELPAPPELEELPPTEEEPTIAPPIEALEEKVVPPVETIEGPAPEIEVVEEPLPELPDWLSESVAAPHEELEWTPPPVTRRKYDLNRASLAELERLPGVGFIMAQQVINYREQRGAFKTVDDLLKVPNFSPATLETIRENLYVETRQEPPAPPITMVILPEEPEAPAELLQARQLLGQGDLKGALEQYAILIRSGHFLSKITDDLQEAVQHYPVNYDAWQNLGDAYLRQDLVKEALQAYTKAEQLLS